MTEGSSSTGTTIAPPPPAPPPPPSAPQQPGSEPPRHRPPGMTAGIVLILVGIVLLIAQFVPGVQIWQLWPFFIIVPGVVQCFTPDADGWTVQRFFDGLVTISIGLILLGNTTGYLSWSVWWEILQLWPVLLISAGLGILGKATKQGWLRAAGTAVVLLAFAYATAVTYSGSTISGFMGVPGGAGFEYAESLGPAQEARLSLKSGVAEINVDDVPGARVEVEGTSPFGEPSMNVSFDGGTADVDFALTEQGDFMIYPGAPSARVNAALGRDILWDAVFETGVSRLDADLSDVAVRRVELKTGVSSSTIRLGEAPEGTDEGRIDVRSGVSSVRILVPDDAEVRVESDSGLTGHTISGDLESQGGGAWETPGFSSAQKTGSPVWLISVKSGVGSFTLDTY